MDVLANKNKKFRIAFFISHVIQYRGPLFKKIADNPDMDLSVFFFSRRGLDEYDDAEFNSKVKWDRDLLSGYRYKFLKNFSIFRDKENFFRYLNFGVVPEIVKARYDAVVIYGYGWFISWLIWCISYMLGIRILFIGETNFLQQRGLSIIHRNIRNILLKLFFSKCSAILYIGKLNKQYYRSFDVPEEKLFFWPYSVDNDFFFREHERLKWQGQEIRESYGLDKDKIVILFTGKLILRKRPLDLIMAYSRMQARNKCQLVLAGEGALRCDLERYLKSNNIDGVFMPGFINQAGLSKLYSVADIFVLASDYEPWGLSVNEAMCFEKPIIVSDKVGAGYDLVENNKNGFIFESGDIKRLTEILDLLATDKDMRLRMGACSRAIISEWDYNKDVSGILDSLSK